MKKPVVDYRQFRLSKINEPRFAHLKLFFISWIGYFTLYFLTENLIPVERCHPMHCFLDDLIPFCEFFAIFYVFWYALVFGYLVYYLLYDIDRFKKLQIFIMVTQIIASETPHEAAILLPLFTRSCEPATIPAAPTTTLNIFVITDFLSVLGRSSGASDTLFFAERIFSAI